jgi:hypothetical protein
MACEFDSRVYELTKRNIAGLDRTIDLQHGDYQSLLADRHLPPDHLLSRSAPAISMRLWKQALPTSSLRQAGRGQPLTYDFDVITDPFGSVWERN